MMLALTVQQPWAWAIVHGGKDVENRTGIGTWRRAEGERLLIHAGRRWSERGQMSRLIRNAYRDAGFLVGPDPHSALFEFGAIIGQADCVEVHEADDGCCDSKWAEREYQEHDGPLRFELVHLVLANPSPLMRPVPWRGQLGLWKVDEMVVGL